jgi:GT2 family glycosyltransferase
MGLPPITAVISTRNRGDRIVKAVETILLNDYPDFELRIVDQSTDDLTETSLKPFLSDDRICYIRSPTKGLSTARNIGIHRAQTEFIAMTDDDCEVQKDWLREMAAAFAIDPRIGVVFGNVLPGPHDIVLGFVPAYVANKPRIARNMREKHLVEGMGCCMGLRRGLWQVLGGFDEMLGPGAAFKAADDVDFAIRALLAGYFLYETPRVRLIHHGFRTKDQASGLIRGYWYGAGAAMAKPLKIRPTSIAALLCKMAWRWAVSRSRVASSLGDHPYRWLRMAAFIRGFAAGVILPVDGTTGHYVRQESANPGV